jgi:CRISPR-associated endonuclease/helicase Cas3
MMNQANEARKNMYGDYDWFSTQAMLEYFRQLYSRVESFDEKDIADLLYKKEQNYETASKDFQLIDDNTISVIINWKESSILVDHLTTQDYSNKLQKQLSQYTVSVRKQDFNKLLSYGAIEELMDGIYFLPSADFYDTNVGIKINNQWIDEVYIK